MSLYICCRLAPSEQSYLRYCWLTLTGPLGLWDPGWLQESLPNKDNPCLHCMVYNWPNSVRKKLQNLNLTKILTRSQLVILHLCSGPSIFFIIYTSVQSVVSGRVFLEYKKWRSIFEVWIGSSMQKCMVALHSVLSRICQTLQHSAEVCILVHVLMWYDHGARDYLLWMSCRLFCL
jgi:hypothetical protein